MRKRSWTDDQLIAAVRISKSYRNVLKLLGLIPAGRNYLQVQRRIRELHVDTAHFTGMGWNRGLMYSTRVLPPLELLLVEGSSIQSYKLKKRLIKEGLKTAKCEQCGWAEQSIDGRIPLELDHISGNRYDNRLENLQILCPNCHSLRPTHRGKNKKAHLARVVER
jgi:Zn finger protein HypA/HybF involved in hydrogenase expression